MSVVVRGRVQGVSYRWSTVRQADRLGLTGWVRNRSDGSVELEAEGPEAALETLAAWLREGPPGAHVTGIEVRWIDPTGEPGFEIRR